MPVNRESTTRLGGVARLIAEAEHLVANREPDQREVTSKAQRSKIEAMSAMGQKETSREATDNAYSWRLPETYAIDLEAPKAAPVGFCKALQRDICERCAR